MLRCYKGFSLDKQLYEKGSTGGVATTLALTSLKYGFAEGMVVLNRNVNPPKWIVAKNKDDLLKACGSTYEDLKFPIINGSNGLGQIGKPCDLTRGFTPKISIFCSHTYRPKESPITKEYAHKPKRKIKTLFENTVKCFFCRDHVGFEADVNVGDSQENPKVNVLIVRSLLGARLLESAVKHGLLQLDEIKYVEVKRKQPYLRM